MEITTVTQTNIALSNGDVISTDMTVLQVAAVYKHVAYLVRTEGRKVVPIRFVRDLFEVGLREAKYFVDDAGRAE